MSQCHNITMPKCHMCTDINNERRRSSVGFTSLQVIKVQLPQNTFTLVHFWHWCAILHIAMQKIFVYFVNFVADERILLLKQCWIYQPGQILSTTTRNLSSGWRLFPIKGYDGSSMFYLFYQCFIWLNTGDYVSYPGIWRGLNVWRWRGGSLGLDGE